jgi:hypothetical protein
VKQSFPEHKVFRANLKMESTTADVEKSKVDEVFSVVNPVVKLK